MFDTIVALATPPLLSALAIIRVSGNDCFRIVSGIFSKDLTRITEKQIVYGYIKSKDEVVDEVILNVYIGPRSFTGEDLVEIMCHGSPLIANQIIELLVANGARLATRGEYTSRSYLNKRIDLIQAEAVNDLIHATSIEAKKLSLLSLQGKTSRLLLPLKTRVADLLSLVEVNIDYPEYEDIEQVTNQKIIDETEVMHQEIKRLLEEGKQGQIIREGIKVAIIGKPNVGKSSLLNALLREDKAIVTSTAGTTRDIVEGEINLNGLILHLLDTAGIRTSDDVIENIGISKAKAKMKEADLVLLVLDASGELTEEDALLLEETADIRRLVVHNKADLIEDHDKGKLYISAEKKEIASLEEAITGLFGLTCESYVRPSLYNARQLGLLSYADDCLMKAKADACSGLPVDLISVSLQAAYQNILEILGETNKTDLTDEIFSRFCVGK